MRSFILLHATAYKHKKAWKNLLEKLFEKIVVTGLDDSENYNQKFLSLHDKKGAFFQRISPVTECIHHSLTSLEVTLLDITSFMFYPATEQSFVKYDKSTRLCTRYIYNIDVIHYISTDRNIMATIILLSLCLMIVHRSNFKIDIVDSKLLRVNPAGYTGEVFTFILEPRKSR